MTRPLSSGPPRPRGRPRKRAGPPKPEGRRRGGQPGNRNRWRHGRFSAAARAEDGALRAQLRRIDFVIAEVLAWHTCDLATVISAREDLSQDTEKALGVRPAPRRRALPPSRRPRARRAVYFTWRLRAGLLKPPVRRRRWCMGARVWPPPGLRRAELARRSC